MSQSEKDRRYTVKLYGGGAGKAPCYQVLDRHMGRIVAGGLHSSDEAWAKADELNGSKVDQLPGGWDR